MSRPITTPEEALNRISASMMASVMLAIVQMSAERPDENATHAEKEEKSSTLFRKLEKHHREVAASLLNDLELFFKGEESFGLQDMAGARGLSSTLGESDKLKNALSLHFSEMQKAIELAKQNIVRDFEDSRTDKVA